MSNGNNGGTRLTGLFFILTLLATPLSAQQVPPPPPVTASTPPAAMPVAHPASAPEAFDRSEWISSGAPSESAPLNGPPALAKEAEATAAPPRTDAQILDLLRSNSQQALTLTDLAAVNDMLKRLEYQVEVEHKMSEMKLGVTPAAVRVDMGGELAAQPGVARRGLLLGARELAARYSILQVSGARGRYMAVLSGDGGQLVRVHVGDALEGGRIAAITLRGVQVAGDGGSAELPFVSPYATAGIIAVSQP